jgi:hypothetical protein
MHLRPLLTQDSQMLLLLFLPFIDDRWSVSLIASCLFSAAAGLSVQDL